MKKDTTKMPADVTDEKLFDNWFDPVETQLRTKVRGFIEAMELMMAEKQTALQQIKKLDEERAKLLESAKADALARAEEAINELTALGFDYELVEPARATARKTRTARKTSGPDHHPKRTCPICEYATKPRTIKGLTNFKQKRSRLRMRNLREESCDSDLSLSRQDAPRLRAASRDRR